MQIQINRAPFPVAADHRPCRPVVVVSHERSGTHFLMNSIAANSVYTVDPFLNFDHNPLGDEVNFFSGPSVRGFFDGLLQMRVPAGSLFLKSIIKSHHAHPFLVPLFGDPRVRILYIHRDPTDTLTSLWRFLHRWDWYEGPRTATPLALAQHPPEGRLLRYQYHHAATHFDRWADHVSGWLDMAATHDNVMALSYARLCEDFAGTVRAVLGFLEQPAPATVSAPPRDAYIQGESRALAPRDRAALAVHIEQALSRHPQLDAIRRSGDWRHGPTPHASPV